MKTLFCGKTGILPRSLDNMGLSVLNEVHDAQFIGEKTVTRAFPSDGGLAAFELSSVSRDAARFSFAFYPYY